MHIPRPVQNSGSAPAITSLFTHLLLSHITTILDKLFNQLHGTNYTAFHNQDFFNKYRPSCDYTNTLWLALPSVPVTQYRYHYEKIDKGMGVSPHILQCNGQFELMIKKEPELLDPNG